MGTKLVADAGATMKDIVAQVTRVTDLIGEISNATGEQTQGIGMVSAAMSQLDSATQQNTRLVEQSAAAAETLKQQADELMRTIGYFRMQAAWHEGRVSRRGARFAMAGADLPRHAH